ncbi:MAG: cytochrome c [Betaproteobacteria bacterium]|nr:cytochrome c [Betaproteobacteria bacterium]
MTKKNLALNLLAAASAACFAASALAQHKPEDLVKHRQAAMSLMGWYFGPIGAMVNNKMPFDAKLAARNAGYLVTLSRMPLEGFDPSTSGAKNTKAKDKIYLEMDKFKRHMEKMQTEVDKLDKAAQTGNEADIKVAFGNAAKSCKSCHDDFRAK